MAAVSCSQSSRRHFLLQTSRFTACRHQNLTAASQAAQPEQDGGHVQHTMGKLPVCPQPKQASELHTGMITLSSLSLYTFQHGERRWRPGQSTGSQPVRGVDAPAWPDLLMDAGQMNRRMWTQPEDYWSQQWASASRARAPLTSHPAAHHWHHPPTPTHRA